MMNKYDAIIIGFGKAGKTLAGEFLKRNWKVALIEKSEKMYGGTCINVACIPSKTLVTLANKVPLFSFSSYEEKAAYYLTAIHEERRVVSLLRNKNYHKLADQANMHIYLGVGSFVSSHEVKITNKDQHEEIIYGDKIIIDTGSSSFIPAIDGLHIGENIYTSEQLLDEERLPKHLIIIGGGYIGCEFASFYRNFGSQVTILQDGITFLAKEDEDTSNEILKQFEKKGIEVTLGFNTLKVERNGQEVIVFGNVDGKQVEVKGDALLVATGRRPNIKSLNLDLADVKTNSRGIEVNEFNQTSQPHIYAVGDCNGGPQYTYISLDDYRIVRNHIFQESSYNKTNRGHIPFSLFINPPLARIGLTEKEAKQQGYSIKVAKMPTSSVPKAQVLGETDGFLKAIVDVKTNHVLGVTLLCAESYEMINQVKMVMDQNLPYNVLKDQIYTHPTMSEAFNDLFDLLK